MSVVFSYAIFNQMLAKRHFERRGIVEGFFGPPWSMSHRAAIFDFGAQHGMNTYLYAPKDDPYHRQRWKEPYPAEQWRQLSRLIELAKQRRIDFVYGFHPGKGLCFREDEPIRLLLEKAARFYQEGVRTFAVLFDDIPSSLQDTKDHRAFHGSLARAEATWLTRILAKQPASWTDVEWWICPSYYTEDPLLARTFGSFEPRFLETLAHHLPQEAACLWTGPKVVCKNITLAHIRKILKRIKHRLILWDNYPVNDLAMSMKMHLSPLTGRDPRLAEAVYGYLNNPLLQETLSFVPLATCFDYAADPTGYDPEKSWDSIVKERFGSEALPHWKTIRSFCDRMNKSKGKNLFPPLSSRERSRRAAARHYLLKNKGRRWFDEFQPWLRLLEKSLTWKAT